jgi:DNA-binding transcriptional regulator YdaS (Cro superfamily)
MNEHIAKAIEILGSQTALAEACGVKQSHVWNWLNRDKVIRLENALLVERATNGKVTKEQIRPDLYPMKESHE